MRIETIMTSPARWCLPTDYLHYASELMWNYDFGFVPVVDETQKVQAVITDRDICMAAYTRGKPLSELRVMDAMSKHLYVCGVRDDVAFAERIMQVEQVRRLPVVDGFGRLAGVLSLSDIARHLHLRHGLFTSLRQEDPLAGDSVAKTFSDIVQKSDAVHAEGGTPGPAFGVSASRA